MTAEQRHLWRAVFSVESPIVAYYGLAFWFLVGGLSGVPASIAGSFFPLIPVFGLAAGYLVGDRLIDRQWLGATLVVVATRPLPPITSLESHRDHSETQPHHFRRPT